LIMAKIGISCCDGVAIGLRKTIFRGKTYRKIRAIRLA
jgi:hypothetical protein